MKLKFNLVPLFVIILMIFSNCQNDNHPEIPHDTAFLLTIEASPDSRMV